MVRQTQNTKKSKSLLAKIWAVICWPFKMIWRFLCWLWALIAGINLVALLNLALLISIIVLFSLLIIDWRRGVCVRNSDVVVYQTTSAASKATNKTMHQVVRPRMNKIASLPVKKYAAPIRVKKASVSNAKADKKVSAKADANKATKQSKPVVNLVPAKQVPITQSVVTSKRTIHGDMIIDSYDLAMLVKPGTHIRGNLYVQNMDNYTLPCNVVIDGNLVVRDVNIVNFCGKFTVRGNIYVSPKSGFSKIPCDARIRGKVIL
ncbi:MAG: hypothetical protein J5608_02110 [Alphaproteobacteria bacterium]|nr:hypothetical protein [Alphaproteobacteria bacterium]